MRNRKELLLSLAVIFILNILIIVLVQRGAGVESVSRVATSVGTLLTAGKI